MRIDVTFRNLPPSDALRAYAHDKVGRVKKVLHNAIEALVVLSHDSNRFTAHATVHGGGVTLSAEESSKDDMYGAIDLVEDKLIRQARRHKERQHDHRAVSTADTSSAAEAAWERARSTTER
jgi:putative sigma-54 modulation protein